jgi:hypothetical protein
MSYVLLWFGFGCIYAGILFGLSEWSYRRRVAAVVSGTPPEKP